MQRRVAALAVTAMVMSLLSAVPSAAATDDDALGDVYERSGFGGHTIRLTGTPHLSQASSAAPATIAFDFVSSQRHRFGLSEALVDELAVEAVMDASHGGATFVRFEQRVRGIKVANAGLVVAIDGDGRVVSVAGPLARGTATGTPRVSALTALNVAAEDAGVDLPVDIPVVSSSARSARFENEFAYGVVQPNDVLVEQAWLPDFDAGSMRLVWAADFEVDGDSWALTYVDAETGEVLASEDRYAGDHAGPEGTVFTGQHPEDSPPRAVVPFTGLDGDWVDDRVTAGNNVTAYRDVDNDNASDYQTQTPASGDPNYQHFNYSWTDAWRTNADDTGLGTDLDAVITQMFYYTNDMHDWAYGYGFTETSFNFQDDNFGRGGTGGDRVLAEAHDGYNFGCLDNASNPIRCRNNANFGTPADGGSPRMQMYMFTPTPTAPFWGTSYADGAMDGDVIAHEYGHGVSSRLVGGSDGTFGYGTHLVHASLGEGWSDVVSYLRWGDAVIGEYVTSRAATGIRRVAYDTSTHTYSDYSPNAATGHPNGEVWATMVYDIRAELGINTTAQLVFDGMKLTGDLPTFMDARDGIIAADAATNGGANYCLLWRIFADRGLGENATFSFASMSAPTDNFDIPAACVPDADAGGPYVTDEGTDVALNGTGSTEAADASGGAIVLYEWDLDNDGAFDDALGATPLFTDVGDDGVHTVSLRVTNAAGVADEDTTTVTVDNVAPSVAIDPVASVSENTPITLTGLVSDPGWEDSLTATVDWDDGAGPQPLAGVVENVRPDATLTFSVGHTYGDDGAYTVTVCGSDDDGGVGCDSTVVVITNTDPTAAIGEDTYVAHAGDPVDVTGESTDPGSDDLTATWTWGDGEPDTVQTSLVNDPLLDPPKSPSIQPRDVAWAASHTYAEACLYELDLMVVDDDGGSAADAATVIITGNDHRIRSKGYWTSQYRPKNPNHFTTERLVCYLAIVKHMSSVFDEARGPLDTRDDAVAVFRADASVAANKLDAQLLAAWLNFANGSYDLDTMVDTDGDGTVDTAYGDALAAAEAVRLNPASTDAALLEQKDVLDRLNNAG